MGSDQPLLTWQDLGGIFGGWGFLFGILESLDVPLGLSVATVIVPVLVTLVVVQVRLSRKKAYSFLPGTHGQAVDAELLRYVEGAKSYVLLSHFRWDAPSNTYLEALSRARQRGVRVRRLVGCAKDELTNHEGTAWILDQMRADLADHRFLSLGDRATSLEIYVFDGVVGALALPAADPLSEGGLPNTLVSRDLRFIKSLEKLYTDYWKQAQE